MTTGTALTILDTAEATQTPLARARVLTRERMAPTLERIAAQREELQALHDRYSNAVRKVSDTLEHRHFARVIAMAGLPAERTLASLQPKARELATWCLGWMRTLDEAVADGTAKLGRAGSEATLLAAEAGLGAAIRVVQPAEVPRMLRELAGGVEHLVQLAAPAFDAALGPEDAAVALEDLRAYVAMFAKPEPTPPAKAARTKKAAA
jgi:hypothetical protein